MTLENQPAQCVVAGVVVMENERGRLNARGGHPAAFYP